jgi:dTDP-4-amino-4,6-dideoxygalactose transaminase
MIKNNINDLAFFGGTPCFTEPLHVGRPNIGDRKRLFERINDLLDRRWLTNGGPYLQEFERNIEKLLGVKHCIAMCNGTIALEILFRALGLSGEVIIPSFTFIATAHALKWLDITPVFCDIDPVTHNLDSAKIEALITPRTTAIMGVHVWGRACHVDELSRIAQKHQLKLIFDAAHAFGCSYQGKMIGNFGRAEVFSFHATKFLNTFEGGAVVTNDDELAEKLRYMTNFGFKSYDLVEYLGTNGKMNEVSAAMGLTMLEDMQNIIRVNHGHYQQYVALTKIPGIRMIKYDEAEKNNYQYVILEIDEDITGLPRDLIVDILHAENILARRYFYPGCHEMEPYRSLNPQAGSVLPETERLTRRVLSLPSGTAVSSDDINSICSINQFLVENGADISRRAKEFSGLVQQ